MKWLKATFPGIYKFVADWVSAFNMKPDGHSLKKWLAVGMFYLICCVVRDHTTDENLEYVLTVLVSTMLTLAGIYTVADYKTKKLNKSNPPADAKPEDSTNQS